MLPNAKPRSTRRQLLRSFSFVLVAFLVAAAFPIGMARGRAERPIPVQQVPTHHATAPRPASTQEAALIVVASLAAALVQGADGLDLD